VPRAMAGTLKVRHCCARVRENVLGDTKGYRLVRGDSSRVVSHRREYAHVRGGCTRRSVRSRCRSRGGPTTPPWELGFADLRFDGLRPCDEFVHDGADEVYIEREVARVHGVVVQERLQEIGDDAGFTGAGIFEGPNDWRDLGVDRQGDHFLWGGWWGWRAKNRARALRGLRSTISVSGAHGPGRAVGLDSIGGKQRSVELGSAKSDPLRGPEGLDGDRWLNALAFGLKPPGCGVDLRWRERLRHRRGKGGGGL